VLSAIIVNYKTPAELAAAVASLRAQRVAPDELIVVDNGAADGDPLPRMTELVGVTVAQPKGNLGYGAGCNLGISRATGDELLIMNADVVLSAGALEAMSKRLRRDRQTAVVGPRIFSGGELQASARAFPSLRTGLLGRRSLLTRLLVQARRYPSEFRHAYGPGGPVDWVSGACMLIRRSPIEDIGGFDEDYWMYWEDADLCRRLFNAGWEVQFEPNAHVHHATGASGTSERTIVAFHQSAARFAVRHIARTRLERLLIERMLRLRCRLVLRRFSEASQVS
jgi:N-acetylglucosaminyl-diphospho-decaprenol L-rhamnosyltransferase